MGVLKSSSRSTKDQNLQLKSRVRRGTRRLGHSKQSNTVFALFFRSQQKQGGKKNSLFHPHSKSRPLAHAELLAPTQPFFLPLGSE